MAVGTALRGSVVLAEWPLVRLVVFSRVPVPVSRIIRYPRPDDWSLWWAVAPIRAVSVVWTIVVVTVVIVVIVAKPRRPGKMNPSPDTDTCVSADSPVSAVVSIVVVVVPAVTIVVAGVVEVDPFGRGGYGDHYANEQTQNASHGCYLSKKVSLVKRTWIHNKQYNKKFILQNFLHKKDPLRNDGNGSS